MKVLLAFFFSISTAFAYTFTNDFRNGYYWGSYPIPLVVVAKTRAEGDNLRSILSDAVDEWEGAIGQDIWEISSNVVIGSGAAGNEVRFSDNFAAETGFDAVGTLAVAIRYHSGTFYSQTKILLNGGLGNIRYDNDNLYRVVLHELGHTIGLDHSAIAYAMMAPYISATNSLQPDDIAGGNAVVDENNYRRSIGFVSPLAGNQNTQESNALSSCGTVNMNGGQGPGAGGGGRDIFSLLLGLSLIPSLGLLKKKKTRKAA